MKRSQLDAVLDSAFRIRPGEARVVGLMFTYLMGVVSTFIVGRTVRDTLFLHRVALDKLSLMYVAVALSVAASAYIYSRFADRYRRDRLIVGSLAIFAVVILTLWALIATDVAGSALYFVLYVAIEIIGAISIIQFWTFANDIFSGRQGKRLFGVIGAGGVLANIVCGFGIGSLAPLIGSENLLVVIAALFILCMSCVRAIAREGNASQDLASAVKKPKGTRGKRIGIAKDSETVLHSKHLKLIAMIVVLTFLTVTIVDYQFKVIAKSSFTEERQLASFFGYFYGFTGILGGFIQFFVTGRLLERSGIVVALSVLPAAILLGAGSMLLVPIVTALMAVTIAKASENVFRYTINDATTQLLYVPVPSHLRGRSKAFIDGILKPASIGVSGVVLYFLSRSFTPREIALDLAYVDVMLVAAWLLMVAGIRKEYIRSLLSTLRSRKLDFDTSFSRVLDDSARQLVRDRLTSNDEREILHALELLPSLEADFQPELTTLLGHDSEAVRIAALRIVGDSGRLEAAPQLFRMMGDGAPGVRAAAIRAFCAVGRERAIRASATFLQDESNEVRGAAVAAMIKHGGLDGILTAAETLKSFLGSDDAEQRLHGARVLAEIEVKNFFQPILRLIQDPDPRVRVAAIEAAGAMQSPELVPSIIYKLNDRAATVAAMRALVAYGPSVERTLLKVLGNRAEDLRIRRRVPRVLANIGGQDSVTELLEALDSEDPELRAALAKAAARIRERMPNVDVSSQKLDHAIHSEIQQAYQALAVIEDLDLSERELLPEALYARHRSHLGLAFRLLEIRYPARTIQLVYSNLDAENKAVRANAVEVVDNVLDRDEAKLLLPLLEDHTREEKIRAGQELFTLERCSSEDWIGRLVEDPHPWIVTCALYIVGERRLRNLESQVLKHVESPDSVVRETAYRTLARLLGETDDAHRLRGLLEAALEDRTDDVRRAGEAELELLSV